MLSGRRQGLQKLQNYKFQVHSASLLLNGPIGTRGAFHLNPEVGAGAGQKNVGRPRERPQQFARERGPRLGSPGPLRKDGVHYISQLGSLSPLFPFTYFRNSWGGNAEELYSSPLLPGEVSMCSQQGDGTGEPLPCAPPSGTWIVLRRGRRLFTPQAFLAPQSGESFPD